MSLHRDLQQDDDEDTSRFNTRELDDFLSGMLFRDLKQEECLITPDELEDGCLQLFVRLINGNSIQVRVRRSGTVLEVMNEIEKKSRIPVTYQRLIYNGKQICNDSMLNEYGICNDSRLELVARMSTRSSIKIWREVEELNYFMQNMICSKEHGYEDFKMLKFMISSVFSEFYYYERIKLESYVNVLVDSSFPAKLIQVYLSVESEKQQYVSDCINMIFSACLNKRSTYKAFFYPLILEFGKTLSTLGYENKFYLLCRRALAQLVSEQCLFLKVMTSFPNILPFICQMAEKISAYLVSQSLYVGPSMDDIRDLKCFYGCYKHVIIKHSGPGGRGSVFTPIPNAGTSHDRALKVTMSLYSVYMDLLEKLCSGLQLIENDITPRDSEQCHIHWLACSYYLPILELLYGISKLYSGAEENLQTILGSRKAALSYLILTYSGSITELLWLIGLKGLLDFKAKTHMVSSLFLDVVYDYEEMNELLIDRSNLLAESFEYMKHIDRNTLHSMLHVEFKNEEATGPGVLREWFIMVFQAIFYTGNLLFTACPNDRRRFFLNPASTVDSLHTEYLHFCGKMVALALRHKVQVGITFDQVFFLQLAGIPITLEDIKVADSQFYNSCKHILDMDAEFIDTDALGLTFVIETEEMGSRNVLELCPDGKNILVNSRNRDMYVELLIFNRFVLSTSNQLLYFTLGFIDVLEYPSLRSCLFRILNLEDLDLLLMGSSTDISVEDWMAHTVYNGYNETDSQIVWFWKVVDEMSSEQRSILLYFWTSVKYPPPEGFRGLNNNNSLQLSNVQVSLDRLPTSQTCFYKLCMPPYSSLNMMRSRLNVITQEHVGLGFGSY